MRRRLQGVVLALAVAVLGATAIAADLGGDKRTDSPIMPFEKQFDTLSRDEVHNILRNLNVRPPASENTKTELRRILTLIEIIRVDPQDGNNPFNTEDPIDNATVNGIVQQVAVDDLDNNNNADGLNGCIGQTVVGQPSSTAPPEFRFVNMVVDPVTLDCTIFGGNSVDGAFLIFQLNQNDVANINDNNLSIFPDALVPVWTIIDPAAGFVNIDPFIAAQSIQITLQANNGVTIRGTFTLTPIGITEFSVTVVNLEVL